MQQVTHPMLSPTIVLKYSHLVVFFNLSSGRRLKCLTLDKEFSLSAGLAKQIIQGNSTKATVKLQNNQQLIRATQAPNLLYGIIALALIRNSFCKRPETCLSLPLPKKILMGKCTRLGVIHETMVMGE